MQKILIGANIMEGCLEWFRARVGTDPFLREAVPNNPQFDQFVITPDCAWYLPDGRVLPERPTSEHERYFALACRRVLLEYEV